MFCPLGTNFDQSKSQSKFVLAYHLDLIQVEQNENGTQQDQAGWASFLSQERLGPNTHDSIQGFNVLVQFPETYDLLLQLLIE